MFQRIVRDYDGVQILSQPTSEEEKKPWIVTIDNFVLDEEIDLILSYGEKTGYEQAQLVYHGNHAEAQTTLGARNSEVSWCGYQVRIVLVSVNCFLSITYPDEPHLCFI
jgi:hypothetical protein